MLKTAGIFGVVGILMGATGVALFLSVFVSMALIDSDPNLQPTVHRDSFEQFSAKMAAREEASGRIWVRAPIGMGLMIFGAFIAMGAGTVGAAGGVIKLAKVAERELVSDATCAFCGATRSLAERDGPCPSCGARRS